MKIEKTWHASSEPEKFLKGNELVNLAKRWGVGIEVSITKPYSYSRGSVERIIINKNVHDRKSAHLHNTK